MKYFFTLITIFITHFAIAQIATYSELTPMPEPISNNAVTMATVGGEPCLFTFSGIDETKIWSGIHKRAYRYKTNEGVWDTIAPLPTGNGRLAAGASTVKNKIYIIGGYEVAQNGDEISVNLVHRYDPETNAYLTDGQPIPIAIDDHVQAVWRDSLIYVVTGWSNTNNVPYVQIYNPTLNQWLVGDAVPNNNDYKVFGASGVILGDTIIYMGGAYFGTNYPPTKVLRKGIINPNNPKDILWLSMNDDNASGYRMAAVPFKNEQAIFFGGSNTTYNYNGIAYNGSGGVQPEERCIVYNKNSNEIFVTTFQTPPVMDLRGAGVAEDGRYFVCGGMTANQQVTNLAYEINYIPVLVGDMRIDALLLYPNPAGDQVALTIECGEKTRLEFIDQIGTVLDEMNVELDIPVAIRQYPDGLYYVKIYCDGEYYGYHELIIQH